MRQSELFTRTQKNINKEEVSINAQLLVQAGMVDKLMAGVYTILPLGLRVINKIEQIIREEINALGGQEIVMPSLQPRENWEKTGRWETMDDLYKVKDSSNREFALGPTHEEVVVPLAKKFVDSYKKFPFSIYQFQNKFRMELRAKSGILRGREFLMKDLYSFHLNEKCLDEYYEKAKTAYFKIFERVGLKEKTFLTFASGGSFSKYSHEFQTITSAGEDMIYICKNCHLAINKEIKKEISECPECHKNDFQEEKSVEVGNIFKLMNKYTKPFDYQVKDENGQAREVVMGCYGIGLSRLMGTIIETYHDEKGIVWPKAVAPFLVHVLDFTKDQKGEAIYQKLKEQNIEVLLDDRSISAGEKMAEADLLGIPYRIIVSEKSLESGGVEIKERSASKGQIIKIEDIPSFIK